MKAPAGVKSKYLAGGTWKAKQKVRQGKRSSTPGKQKNPQTCQLTEVAGFSRKFWCSSRSYKHKNYSQWTEFQDRVN